MGEIEHDGIQRRNIDVTFQSFYNFLYPSKYLLHLQHFVIYFLNKLQQKVEEEEEFWQNDVIGKTFTSHEKEREAILINGFSSFFLLNIT